MIDWNRVLELRDEIGADNFGELVELFLDEVEAEIEALRSDSHRETLEAQLHFLKGSALNLGFSDFSALCQLGEISASKGAYESVDLVAILKCYDASKAEFLRTLTTMTSA